MPRNKLVAVTGVSGSGKSTLAFDVLYAEGQRRFLDCLPTYVRQFVRPLARPEVDRVEGVPPTVALEQKLSHGSSMSTVGTASEVYHYLRLLFAFCGVAHCPGCGVAGEVVSAPEKIAERIAEHFPRGELWLLAPLVRKRKGVHKEVLAAAEKRGVYQVRIDGELVDLAARPSWTATPSTTSRRWSTWCRRGRGGPSGCGRRWSRRWPCRARACSCTGRAPGDGALLLDGAVLPGLRLGAAGARSAPVHLQPEVRGLPCVRGARRGAGATTTKTTTTTRRRRRRRADGTPCAACRGTRLRPEALAIRVRDDRSARWPRSASGEARAFLRELGPLPAELQEAVLPELETRLRVLEELGLGYLTLDRGAHTLSTGEGQRIRVVAQLASNLRGVCYVLDEPTVGLHPRDSQALARALFGLRDRGNTVVVVEHEEALIRAADHLIDLGPGAGAHGGRIVAAGTPAEVARVEGSVTGAWLRGAGQRRPGRGGRSTPIG